MNSTKILVLHALFFWSLMLVLSTVVVAFFPPSTWRFIVQID